MTRPERPVPRTLRTIATAALALLAGVSALAAFFALREGSALSKAKTLTAGRFEGAEPREVYRVEGLVTEGLLSPPGFPEVESALAFRIGREYRTSPSERWMPDERKSGLNERVSSLVIDGIRVELSAKATLATETTTSYHELDTLSRLKIDQQRIIGPLVVFGVVQGGILKDDPFHPLVVVEPAQEASVTQRLTATGRLKGVFMAMTALMFGALALAAAFGPLIIRKLHDERARTMHLSTESHGASN